MPFIRAVRASFALLAMLAVILAPSEPAVGLPRSDALDGVRQRGRLVCGVQHDQPGFATRDAQGRWSGLEVDFCVALAAVVLGRKEAVDFRLLAPTQRFSALKAGEIDLLAARTTWTMSRDSALGLRFAATLLYDGQAMMVRRRQGVASTLELSGGSICALAGHNGDQTVTDYFAERRMRLRGLVTADSWDTLVKAYQANQCVGLAGDATELARTQAAMKDSAEHVILPERLTLEPVGVMVREGDERWFSAVRWTMAALVAAEEAGITQATIEGLDQSSNGTLAVRRLLGLEADLGQAIGLPRDWARQAIRSVGNYGEIYDRSFGAKAPLRMVRGFNQLWSKGGLMLAPPLR